MKRNIPRNVCPNVDNVDSKNDKAGIVYLVGAGPGDAGLITVRGADCLRRADVVVYDNLANPDLLCYAPDYAELIYAGKKADQHTKSQDEINGILVDRARRGLTVVRLKGGDPFLFGRGGEEAGALSEQNISWEIVPGVTSAIAVPAYSGIPVTHRIMNGSLHVVTGHENMDGVGPDVDWSVLARSRGTIVILMGVKNLRMISSELMKHGLAGETPAAMIRWGTLAEQKTLVSRLDRIADDVASAEMKPPAVCVIGEVVKLREELAWIEKRPLFGVRVAVTRPVAENDRLAAALDAMGAEVVRTPTLKVVVRELDGAAREMIGRLGRKQQEPEQQGQRQGFDWVALTSANGARLFADALAATGKDARCLAGTRLAAIGPRTADAMAARGLVADLVATDSRQEGLADLLCGTGFQPVKGLPGGPESFVQGQDAPATSILIARAAQARPVLEERLAMAGARTEVLPLYDTVPDPVGIARLLELLRRGKVHVVTFTSARTFEALAEAAGKLDFNSDSETETESETGDGKSTDIKELLRGCAVAVVGPVTRQAVEAAGVAVAIEAEKADMDSLAAAIRRWRE